jgi:hypothetical protein
MQYQTEAKLQCWRALAITGDGTEHLLYLGRSAGQVRAGYATAFVEMLDGSERRRIRHIALQRWNGAADEGQWAEQATLAIPPSPKKVKLALASTG